MGNINSQFLNDFVLSYQSTHSPTPVYTIKLSQTRWAAVYKGLPSNRSNISDEMVLLDEMTFYSISILSTEEPIDEWTYLEIYQDFKGKPIYHWGRIPKHVSKMVKAGVWGLADLTIDQEEELLEL
tara:strand:+ start:836 stop:1213 length:378 start_codon:yes stop_codon:yes gene_type:complete